MGTSCCDQSGRGVPRGPHARPERRQGAPRELPWPLGGVQPILWAPVLAVPGQDSFVHCTSCYGAGVEEHLWVSGSRACLKASRSTQPCLGSTVGTQVKAGRRLPCHPSPKSPPPTKQKRVAGGGGGACLASWLLLALPGHRSVPGSAFCAPCTLSAELSSRLGAASGFWTFGLTPPALQVWGLKLGLCTKLDCLHAPCVAGLGPLKGVGKSLSPELGNGTWFRSRSFARCGKGLRTRR